MNFDLIIVGGGAAGIMAAISAKRHQISLGNSDFKIAILDRTLALGRKILVCGAGRCNITNINLDKSVKEHYYVDDFEFLESIFMQFGYKEIVSFFNELGIDLYVERKTDIGKLFPITDQAKTITSLLEDELHRLGVQIFLNTEVRNILKKEKFEINCFDLEQKKDLSFNSKYLILSAGGKTYPALGSNGSGYDLAQNLGHTIIAPVPSALPLVSKNPLSQELQGSKMEVEVTSIIDGNKIKTRSDDLMFTQYGASGPAALNISREISININREHKAKCEIVLNFFPGKNKAEVQNILEKRWQKRPDQNLELSLYGIFPNKIATALLKVIGMPKDKKNSDLSNGDKEKIINNLTEYKIKIDGTRGWNEAEFTAGGVKISEVKNTTLESKKIQNLYFCGEILDVDGDVGGFNLSWAWSSGFVAGKLG